MSSEIQKYPCWHRKSPAMWTSFWAFFFYDSSWVCEILTLRFPQSVFWDNNRSAKVAEGYVKDKGVVAKFDLDLGGGFYLSKFSRWCFQTCSFSPRTLGKWSNLTVAYFSDGLVKNHHLVLYVWLVGVLFWGLFCFWSMPKTPTMGFLTMRVGEHWKLWKGHW